ncbi:MAG TPA: amino acid ABC transporter permease, partial [Citricoccus sp.]
LRGAITPLGNTLIALTKNTTVAAAASVAEASGLMKTMIEFNPNLMVYIFLTIAIGFCIIVIPMGILTTWLSDKLAVAR